MEGSSARARRHLWRLRGEASAGSELFRQRLEGEFRFREPDGAALLKVTGSLDALQYRSGSGYSLSSDKAAGRVEARGYLPVSADRRLEVRGWLAARRYAAPSTLEVDQRETGGRIYLTATTPGAAAWRVGGGWAARSYPDTTEIDRTTLGLEGDFDLSGGDGRSLRFHHRSDRRAIAIPEIKPSSWIHWSELNAQIPVSGFRVFGDLQNEVWRYDRPDPVYFPSWRIRADAGAGWGDILAVAWKLGVSVENLDSGEDPESYFQYGLLGGLESFGNALTGSLNLEFGRRRYSRPGDSEDPTGDLFEYSDFDYWKIWASGSLLLGRNLSLDLLAGYEPQRHTEQQDDSALGFGTLRLVWRPRPG